MSEFSKDVASAARKFGMASGATAGLSAGSAVYSGVMSTTGSVAMTVAVGANPLILGAVVFTALTYAGWWVAKKVTEPLECD